MAEGKIQPGLKGVVAAQTRLSNVDGQAGKLLIAGFPIEVLAARASFEEVTYLLWHDTLPNSEQLACFRQMLIERCSLPAATLRLLQDAAAQKVSAIDALLMGVSTLGLHGKTGLVVDTFQDEALTLVACFPAIVAAYWRLLKGSTPLPPNPALGYAANYLYMLFGEMPSLQRTRALEAYLSTVIDHGLNASTFTARVIVSTQADMIAALTGALGALKGPLHGGAPGPVLEMILEVGESARIEPYLRDKLDRGERLMGFGHPVYKVRDPRAEILSTVAERLYRADDSKGLYELALQIEKAARMLLAEYKPGRNLQTNVEFYTALLLNGLGLHTALFTPTFAIGRVAGWTAHCFEQRALNQIIRPSAVYAGQRDRPWVPLEAR